jgi:hypothetical protein
MGVKEFVSEHTSLDVTRPGNSLKNWFIGIPIAISLVFGVVVEGNPVSKFVSSLGVGARRGVGSAITETQPQMQEGVESLYGRPTQPGDLSKRKQQSQGQQTQCNNGWCWKN